MPRSSALRVVHDRDPIDLAGAERAAHDFLVALRVPLDAERMRDTPARMAHAYAELFTSRSFELTTFPNEEGYDELVLARAIPVRSVCEHHLLPFVGIAHVGYLPGERILGLSKAGAGRRILRSPSAGTGAADQADRGLAVQPPRRRRGGS